MQYDFKNKVVLVTGGNSGIGLACVKRFYQSGAKVIATGRRKLEELKSISSEDKEYLTKIDYVVCDVAKPAEVDNLFNHINKQYNQLDIGINNAGITGAGGKKFTEFTIDEYNEVIDINLKGLWLCMQHELKIMERNKKGTIVNVSSVAGIRGAKISPLYGMTKFGVNGLTRSAALEYAKLGIRINSVCPSPIDTPLFQSDSEYLTEFFKNAHSFVPLGRAGTSDEVANLIVWLASEEASFMTGAVIPVDGGVAA